MKLLIQDKIYIELSQKDQKWLKSNVIWFDRDSKMILEQKCRLPEEIIYDFLRILEGYDYNTDLIMGNIGVFDLKCE